MAAAGNPDRGDARASSKSAGARAIVVERMTHESIPEICGLYKRVWDHFPDLPTELVKKWEPTPLEFTSWMEGVTYFAARVDGKMIGAIGCELADGSCRLVQLVVDPDGRRQGVATALVHQGLEWARKNKSPSVWADSLERFTGAAGLLRQLGFAECGVLHRHHFGEDVRLFEKIL